MEEGKEKRWRSEERGKERGVIVRKEGSKEG